MDQPLGAWRQEQAPSGTGGLGYISHTTYNGTLQNPDLGLTATGTQPLAPTIRVADSWQQAAIMDVAHGNGDLTAGMKLCQSGFSTFTQTLGTYQCGTLVTDCTRTMNLCTAYNPDGLAYGGDSGGPVWWYTGTGGVKLLGWVSQASATAPNGEHPYMYFVPTWALQDHTWAPTETWTGGPGISPFPSGNDGTGCFLTWGNNCIKA